MNERLKEFAFEARLITVDGITRYASDYEFEKRFADLIVRECAEVANKNRTEMEIKTNTQLTADAIKQHFGVEE